MKHRYGGLFFWIAAGLLIRAYLASIPAEIEVDGTYMALLARSVLKGEAYFRSIIPPFYSYLMVWALPFSSGLEEAGRWVSVILGTASLPLIYLLGRYFFSHRVGVMAVALAALEPSMLFYSYSVLSESTYLFIFLSALILSFILIKKQFFLLAVGVGLIWGIAFLTRQEGAILLGILMFVLLGNMVLKKTPILRGATLIFFLSVGFFSVAFPYIRFIHQTTGEWALSDKSLLHIRSGIESVSSNDPMQVEKFIFGLTADKESVLSQKILTDPAVKEKYKPKFYELAKMFAVNAAICLKIGLPKWLPPLLYLFLGIGLFLTLKEKTLRKKWLWLLPILPCYFVFPFIYYQNRFLFTLIPFCLILAAYGITLFSTQIFKKEWGVWILFFFIVASFVPETATAALKRKGSGELAKQVGFWLQENFPKGGRFMARYPQIPFYGGGDPIAFPYAPLEDILIYARAQKVDALILQKSVVMHFRPWLLPLFENPDSAQELKLLYRAKERLGSTQDEILIYGFK